MQEQDLTFLLSMLYRFYDGENKNPHRFDNKKILAFIVYIL
jgi:uncharacterized membrane protein YkvA (DUF1232 family)